jgi:hypothetical protein
MAKQKFNWYDMPMSERAKMAEQLGTEVADIMNKAMNKARKKLEKYGYSVDVDLKFTELEKPKQNQ